MVVIYYSVGWLLIYLPIVVGHCGTWSSAWVLCSTSLLEWILIRVLTPIYWGSSSGCPARLSSANVGLSLDAVLGVVRAYLPRLERCEIVGSDDLDLDAVLLVVQAHHLQTFLVRVGERTLGACISPYEWLDISLKWLGINESNLVAAEQFPGLVPLGVWLVLLIYLLCGRWLSILSIWLFFADTQLVILFALLPLHHAFLAYR